jgi:hypothetical protein
MLEVIGNRIGGSSSVNAAFIAGGVLAVVLVLLGIIVAHKYAVVPDGPAAAGVPLERHVYGTHSGHLYRGGAE